MESVGVYWINLKPHLLPCIIQEVDNVVKKHRSKPELSQNCC